jgi:hypothetical protein
LHYGEIQSTTCPTTKFVATLSTQCVFQLVIRCTFLDLPRILYDIIIFSLFTDHSKIIGFSFDSTDAATEFWQSVERLISNPENIALSAPGRKRKTKPVKQKPLPPKSQISLPCQFSHVTNVSLTDTDRYHSLQIFMKNAE